MTWKGGWLGLSVGVVLVWRAAGWWSPHPADSSPLAAQRALALLGLWFVGWGVRAWRRRPSPVVGLFTGYCLLSGLHWGGPVGGPGPASGALLLGLYLVAGAAAQSAFLHVALRAGRERPLPAVTLWVVYLPALVAVALFLAVPTPLLGGAFAVEPLLYTIAPSVLWSFTGGFVWLGRSWRSGPRERRERRLGRVAVALVVGYLPHGLAAAGLLPLGELADLASLAFALVPWALASSLASPPPRSSTDSAAPRSQSSSAETARSMSSERT